MKNGDVIINIEDLFTVTFQGWIAGGICAYNLEFHIKEEMLYPGRNLPGYEVKTQFSGTVAEVLEHAAKLVREYNSTLSKRGGGRVL